jgi:hypothetical protein
MAITFEEEKNKLNWIGIITAIVIIGFIGIAVFYLFFSQPAVVEQFIFPNLKTISQFKSVKFSFDDAFSNPAFKNLKSIVNFNLPSDNLIGKSNPFVQ